MLSNNKDFQFGGQLGIGRSDDRAHPTLEKVDVTALGSRKAVRVAGWGPGAAERAGSPHHR